MLAVVVALCAGMVGDAQPAVAEEPRYPCTIHWTGAGDGELWHNSSNWADTSGSQRLPAIDDQVCIEAAEGREVHHVEGSTDVATILSRAPLVVRGGSLQVHQFYWGSYGDTDLSLLDLRGGSFGGPGIISVDRILWSGGDIVGAGRMAVSVGRRLIGTTQPALLLLGTGEVGLSQGLSVATAVTVPRGFHLRGTSSGAGLYSTSIIVDGRVTAGRVEGSIHVSQTGELAESRILGDVTNHGTVRDLSTTYGQSSAHTPYDVLATFANYGVFELTVQAVAGADHHLPYAVVNHEGGSLTVGEAGTDAPGLRLNGSLTNHGAASLENVALSTGGGGSSTGVYSFHNATLGLGSHTFGDGVKIAGDGTLATQMVLDGDVEIDGVSTTAGGCGSRNAIIGAGTLSGATQVSWRGGTLADDDVVTLGPEVTLTASGTCATRAVGLSGGKLVNQGEMSIGGPVVGSGTLENVGSVHLASSIPRLDNDGELELVGGASAQVLDNRGAVTVAPSASISGSEWLNAGTIEVAPGHNAALVEVADLQNTGTLELGTRAVVRTENFDDDGQVRIWVDGRRWTDNYRTHLGRSGLIEAATTATLDGGVHIVGVEGCAVEVALVQSPSIVGTPALTSDVPACAYEFVRRPGSLLLRAGDHMPPSAPTVTSSQPTNAWLRGFQFTVADAHDEFSGVRGISYIIDESADTDDWAVSDADIEAAEATYWAEGSSSGRKWVHVRAVDWSGNWSEPTHLGPFLVDVSPPSRPTFEDMGMRSLRHVAGSTFEVRWTRSVDVHSGLADSPYTVMTHDLWHSEQTTVTDDPRLRFVGKPDEDFCVDVTARDRVDNTTERRYPAEPIDLGCYKPPTDDASFANVRGFSRRTSTTRYFGTFMQATVRRSRLRVEGARGNDIWLIATTCPRCGSIALYWGDVLVKSVSLKDDTLTRKNFIRVPRPSTSLSRNLTVKVTSRDRPVQVDALAWRY